MSSAKTAMAKALVESHFVKGLFVTMSLVLLISQIPVWVSPSRALEKAFTKHKPYGIALAQEVVVSVEISIHMVFVAAVALYTAFRPRRLIISVFLFLSCFFFGAACYQINQLGGSHSVIAALVLNLFFIFLLIVALMRTPPAVVPEKPNLFVRIYFLVLAAFFGISGILDVIIPETIVDSMTTERSSDSYHMSQLKILLVGHGFINAFTAVVAFFSVFEPERSLSVVFGILLFAEVVFFGNLIENRSYYYLDYDSLVASEIVYVVLFVLCGVATLLQSGLPSYTQMVDVAQPKV